jgi:hypothetical protein
MSAPDVPAIARLHSRHKGTVLFTRDDSSMRPLAAIPAALLDAQLPGLLGELDAGSYYSIAGYHEPKHSRIPPGYAQECNVSHLPAAWVDIDGRNAPGGQMEQWQIVSDVMRAVQRRQIPAPSVYADSGRGVWLFWQLETAELATPAAIDLLVRVNRAAVDFFARAGADRSATNISRWTRIPGSVNRATGTRCAYLFAADDQQQPIVYTLAELAEAFGVHDTQARIEAFMQPPAPLPDRPKNRQKQLAGAKGWIAKHRNIIRALMHLQSVRGGYRKGTRNLACHWLVFAMRRAGYDPATIEQHLHAPDSFRPALTAACIRRHVKSELRQAKTKGGKGLSYQRVADDLRITPDEARAIRENTGIAFPHAFQNQLQPPTPNVSQSERIARRRARVSELKTTNPTMQVREIAQVLAAEGVPASSLQRVHSDLVALGLNTPRRLNREASIPLDLPDANTRTAGA